MTDTQTVAPEAATAKLNNKEIIAYLAEKFPLCFTLEGEAKPLKIGLFQDLAAALADDKTVNKTQLRSALRQYTSNWRYLHGCRAGAVRVDLNGEAAGIMEQEHAEHAAQQLAEAKAKLSERRAQERAKEREERTKSKANKKRPPQKAAVKKTRPALKPVELTDLVKGAMVRVNVADNIKRAVVLAVEKENVRVQLDNGLVISVIAERVFA